MGTPFRSSPGIVLKAGFLLVLLFPSLLPQKGTAQEEEGKGERTRLGSYLDLRIQSENTEIEPGTSRVETWDFSGRGVIALAIRSSPSLLADLGLELFQEFGGGGKAQPFLRAGIRGERLEFLLGRIQPLTLGESWITYRSGLRSDLWGARTQLLLFPWIFGGMSLDRETTVQYGVPERFRFHGVTGIGSLTGFSLRYEWFLDHSGGFDTPTYSALRDGAATFQQFAGFLHLRAPLLEPLYLEFNAGRSWGEGAFTPARGRIFAGETGILLPGRSLSLLLAATGFFRDPQFLMHRGLPWFEEPLPGIGRALWVRGNLRAYYNNFFLDGELGELFQFTPSRQNWNFSFLQAGYRFDP